MEFLESQKVKKNNIRINQKYNHEVKIVTLQDPVDLRERDLRFLNGESLDEMMSELDKCDLNSDAGQRATLHSKVLTFLRLDPKNSETFVNILKIKQPSSYSFRIILSAFILSGNEIEQNLLSVLLNDIFYPIDRKKAIITKLPELKVISITLFKAVE